MLDSDQVARRDELLERLFRTTMGATELLHVYVGERLGLYGAMAGLDSVTPRELARAAGVAERYAREWLEEQAVAGILDVAEPNDDAESRRYRLPPGHAEVLVDRDTLAFFAPVARLVVGIAQALPDVLEAFRSGEGVPYEAYGPDLRTGIADANRPMFLQQLASEWLPALPDVESRLGRAEPPGRVGDLGCGSGWSTIALARAFPSARVEGVDLDEASVEQARRNALEAGVGDRVTFVRAEASALPAGATTSSRCSRPCTTWRTRWRCSRPRAGASPTGERSLSATRR